MFVCLSCQSVGFGGSLSEVRVKNVALLTGLVVTRGGGRGGGGCGGLTQWAFGAKMTSI